jgi:cytochrome c biogenesis protein CcmG/thiol:disulfide interchange protein DsbE
MDPAEAPVPDERPDKRREYSGPASTLGLAALVVAVVALGIWWFELRGADGPGTPERGEFGIVALPADLNPTGRAARSEPGRAAPDFRLETVTGAPSRLTDYRGRYVLVNFWASWCGPCRGETPDLQQFARRMGDRAIVLGVNQQEDAATARSFIEQFGVTYPILLDRTGEVSLAFQVGRGLPVSVLVDPSGIVVRIYTGRITREQLDEIAAQAGA